MIINLVNYYYYLVPDWEVKITLFVNAKINATLSRILFVTSYLFVAP